MAPEVLPVLGLGLSSNLDAAAHPHPYRLLDANPGLFDFVEYSAPLSLEEARRDASLFPEMFEGRGKVPVLFHPVHLNLYGPELESKEDLRLLSEHATAVGSPWVGNDVAWWHSGGEPFPGYVYLSPPLTRAGLDDCVAHALHVQEHLSVPLALENPAVIAVRGERHVLDFMAELHQRTGCALVLDLGHLWSHQLARGLALTTGLEGFPFERVVELHLAGGVLTRTDGRSVYVDDHTQPVREEVYELLHHVLPRCTNLRALVFEGDGHPEPVARITLEKLRPLIAAGIQGPGQPWSIAQPQTAFQQWASDPLQILDESFGVSPASEDGEAVARELDFRLAVLAQTLDRSFPISRLLLAGTPAALAELGRSRELRECFAGGRRGVLRAFVAFATRKLRQRPNPGGEAILALEAMRAQSPKARLPPGIDLTEAEFAARSLRRHLSGRAWATGRLELSALDGLAQVVGRATRQVTSAFES